MYLSSALDKDVKRMGEIVPFLNASKTVSQILS